MALNNVTTGFPKSVIPDSVVSQWVTPIDGLSDNDPVDPWPDSVGLDDMDGFGLTYSEGVMGGADAVSGDGAEDHGTVNMGPLSGNTDQDFTVAFAIQTTDSSGGWLGFINDQTTDAGDGFAFGFQIQDGGAGEPNMRLRDSDGNSTNIYANERVDDGDAHTVVFNKITNDASDWEIWIDGDEVNTTVGRDQGFSNPDSFNIDIPVFKVEDVTGTDDGDTYIEADMSLIEYTEPGHVFDPDDVADFHSRAPGV